jgi:branched-subunit amino acid transport protein
VDESLIVVGMALVTYATRYTMIAALGRGASLLDDAQDPSLLRRWLRYMPPTVLATLIVPPVLAPQGRIELGIPLWVTVVGAVVAWRTRSAFWTVLSGMTGFWVLRILGV